MQAYNATTDAVGERIYYGGAAAARGLSLVKWAAEKGLLYKRLTFGALLSLLTGDVFDDTTNSYKNKNVSKKSTDFEPGNHLLLFINGIWNSDKDADDSLEATASKLGISLGKAARVENGTHGITFSLIPAWTGDLLQIVGNELGAIDLPAQRAANQIHEMVKALESQHIACLRIHVVAHSQGTQIFYGALSLLSPKERAMIDYHGFGPERIIGNNWGLAAVENVRNPLDFVPMIGNDLNPVRRPFAILGRKDLSLWKDLGDENVTYYGDFAIAWPFRHDYKLYYLPYLSPRSLK